MNRPCPRGVAHPAGPHPEVAALQEVMSAVEQRLPDILVELPQSHRPLLTNALLNVSINHILAEEGGPATASILQRLAALIAAGERPADGDGLRLNGQDA
ncbi:MAG TPA: hypothetical protein VG651_15885 [Stellaceae bacterium]|nr:hypothetical protein [Stellaceae bacterium]